MIKWFKSLTKQGKIMALLIVVLLVGVILRWDNVRDKALIWFRVDDIMEQRQAEQQADSVKVHEVEADTLRVALPD